MSIMHPAARANELRRCGLEVQAGPRVTDASRYFGMGHGTRYIRLNGRPTPPMSALRPYLETGSEGEQP